MGLPCFKPLIEAYLHESHFSTTPAYRRLGWYCITSLIYECGKITDHVFVDCNILIGNFSCLLQVWQVLEAVLRQGP